MNNNNNKYSCQICNVDFDSQEEYQQHKKEMHGEEKEEQGKKKEMSEKKEGHSQGCC